MVLISLKKKLSVYKEGEIMFKIIKIFIVLLVCFTGTLFAEGVPTEIEAVENLGMGGPGTTLQGKYDILYNPALLGLRSGLHIRIFDLPISISNDIFKFYSYYKDNQDELENFDDQSMLKQTELLQDIADTVTKYKVRIKLSILNPNVSVGPFPFFGRDGKICWGFGLYNQIDAGAKMNAGLLIPTVDFWAKADAIFAVPLAYNTSYMPFGFPGEIYAGINIKYMMRYKYEENRMSVLKFNSFDVDSDDLDKGNGYGWDWGLLYLYSENLRFSLVLKDFLSTRIAYDDSSEVIKGQVSIGSSYVINKMIMVAADLRDIKFGDIGKSTLFTKLYIGGEFNLINILKLRGGFYQGYPSFGFGLAGILNYAFYGRELSDYPGLIPEWNHTVSLSIGF